MNLPHFIETQRTTQRDATGAIVLQGQKRVNWLNVVGNVCQTIATTASKAKQAIEQKLDEVWEWVDRQDRVLVSWIDEGIDQLRNAHFQYDF